MKNNWVSLLALVLSIIALIITFLRIDITISNDTFIGIIASFIGVCATFIVGTQIYNLFETKKVKDDMLNMKRVINDATINIDCALNYIQGLSNESKRPLSAYRDFIVALNYAYDSNNHNAIEDCYNNLKIVIENIKNKNSMDENIEEKKIQIEVAINQLKSNKKYNDFAWRIKLIENERIDILSRKVDLLR